MVSTDEILDLVIEGYSIKEIQERTNITSHGVKYHVTKLLKRFNCKTRHELIARAQAKKSGIILTRVIHNGIDK